MSDLIPKTVEGATRGEGLRVGIVAARFNDLITERLVQGALGALQRAGVTDATVAWVPGAVEIPLAAQAMLPSVDAVLALGCVIRGATAHYDYVCQMAASGIQRVALDGGKPVVFGVLTVDTLEQAFDRAGGKAGNKGAEAAHTALEMAHLLNRLKTS